jgi:hypothetical protein
MPRRRVEPSRHSFSWWDVPVATSRVGGCASLLDHHSTIGVAAVGVVSHLVFSVHCLPFAPCSLWTPSHALPASRLPRLFGRPTAQLSHGPATQAEQVG